MVNGDLRMKEIIMQLRKKILILKNHQLLH